jgi:protein kinase A
MVIEKDELDHTLAENSVLAKCSHPFLTALHYSFQTPDLLCFVMEYVNGGEIFYHLGKDKRFSVDRTRFYIGEITLAIAYLHEQNVIYRDLKLENLMLDRHGHIKITDFGFAKKVPERTFTLCGTPEYLAPEIIQSKGHGKAVDWWALGILIYEMLVGYPPFFDESPFRIYEKILEGKIVFPKWVDARAKDLIKGLLTTDHTKRLGTLKRGVADIKGHKWFAGVDWDILLQKKIPAPIPVRVQADGDSRYFERYQESTEEKVVKLTPGQQELFKGFEVM